MRTGFYLRGAAGCQRRRATAASSRAASRRAATAASTSASDGQAREREAQHGRPVVDADRLQRRAGSGGARRASRTGRREHAARLEGVQQRLGGQAREGERRDVRRARHPRDRRAHARDDGGQRAERRLLEAIAEGGDAFLDAGLDGVARLPRGDAEPDDRRQVLAAAAEAALLPAADPEGRHPCPGAQPQGARAPRAVQLVRGDGDAVRAQRARPQACQAEPLHGVDVQMGALAVTGRPEPAGAKSATGCRVPSSLFTSISATTAVSGRTAAATASALTTPWASGATTSSAQPSPASASAQRMTAGCSSPLTTRWRPRAARAAPSTPRASASVPPLVNSSSPGSTSSAAATSPRAWASARAAAAPPACAEAGFAYSSAAAVRSASSTSAVGSVDAALSR